jgi:hypothetical protein
MRATAFAFALCLTGCASGAPGGSALENDIANSRIWPKAASVFVPAGEEPRRCLQTADTFFVVNDELSIIFMNDGRFYLNRLELRCNDVLISGFTQAAGFGREQICSGTAITLRDRFGGFPNAQCHLGAFEPLELAKADTSDDAIVLNEGETIRRPR